MSTLKLGSTIPGIQPTRSSQYDNGINYMTGLCARPEDPNPVDPTMPGYVLDPIHAFIERVGAECRADVESAEG